MDAADAAPGSRIPPPRRPCPPQPGGAGETRGCARWRRSSCRPLLVVGIFWYVLRQFADLSEVWAAIRTLTWLEIVGLVVAATWNLVTYWILMVIATPGLTYPQSVVVTESTTAVSNSAARGRCDRRRPHLLDAVVVGLLEVAVHAVGARHRHLEQLRQAGHADRGAGHPRRAGRAGRRSHGGGAVRARRAGRRPRGVRADPAERGLRPPRRARRRARDVRPAQASCARDPCTGGTTPSRSSGAG